MFYCNPCGDVRGWPRSLAKSHGRCEICTESRACNDMPSSSLPLPKDFPRVSGITRPVDNLYDEDGNPIPVIPKEPQKINYDRLHDFLKLFTKAERAKWGGTGSKAPDWVLEGMLWFMAQDPGHNELMRRLKDS